MSTILSLLALLVGATAVIIGTRMSLYFYRQEALEVRPPLARRAQASPSEAQIPLERSAPWYLADSVSASSRYAWIGLGVIASIVLLAILVSGMVL
jgi:hypothetical protein